MKKRLLFFTVLLLLLILTIYSGFHYFSNKALNAQLEALNDTLEKQGYEMMMERPVIDQQEGSLSIPELYLKHPGKGTETYFSEVKIQLSREDILNYVQPFSEGLSAIKQVTVSLSEAEHRNSQDDKSFSFDFLSITLAGDLQDFLDSAAGDFENMPQQEHEISGRLLNLQAYYELGPEPANFFVPTPGINFMSFDLLFRPETDQLVMQDVRLALFNSQLQMTGTVDQFSSLRSASAAYRQKHPEATPGPLELNAEITPARADTLGIGADGLGMTFDAANLELRGLINTDDENGQRFFSEHSVNAGIENIWLLSPETFQSTYGQALSFLGLSSESLRIPAIGLSYHLKGDVAEITSFNIENSYADVDFRGGLRYETLANEQAWSWQRAAFLITPSSSESNRFIQNFSSFFGLQIPVVDTSGNSPYPTYQLNVKGQLGTPELDL
jgi:hypothetical protein